MPKKGPINDRFFLNRSDIVVNSNYGSIPEIMDPPGGDLTTMVGVRNFGVPINLLNGPKMDPKRPWMTCMTGLKKLVFFLKNFGFSIERFLWNQKCADFISFDKIMGSQ